MDMSRISACSYPLRERPWQEALAVIAGAGFDKVDLLGRAPHLSLDPDECDPVAIKRSADALGVQIANLGTYPGRGFASENATERERELEQLQRAINIAALLGSRSIRVMPGDDDPDKIPQIAEWFRRGARHAAERGVYMGYETHGGGISGNPEHCVALADQVSSPYFGVLYDPCNVMAAGIDYRMALWTMREHIIHVHLKDGAVSVDRGFERVMLGEGHLDIRWIVDALDTLGYEGHLALEYELDTEPPETGLPKWLDAARRI